MNHVRQMRFYVLDLRESTYLYALGTKVTTKTLKYEFFYVPEIFHWE